MMECIIVADINLFGSSGNVSKCKACMRSITAHTQQANFSPVSLLVAWATISQAFK